MQVDFPRALEDYNAALELSPDLAVALYNRGTVKYRMGDYAEAEKDLKRAAEAEPDNKEFQEGLSECQKQL